jgi:uncharacterized protein YgiM (DUF1202 family)
MSKFNYSKQFKKEETPEVVEPVVETTVEPVAEELPTPKMEVKTGVVTGCEKLRVRKGPSKQNNVAAIVGKGREVVIEEELQDWYKVRIAGGIVGYCMAEFITVK